MEKNRVIVFTTSYFPFAGGAEIAIREVAKKLIRDFGFLIVTSRVRKDLSQKETMEEGEVFRIGLGTKWDKYMLPILGIFYAIRNIYPQTILWGMDISAGSLVCAFIKVFYPKTPFLLSIQYGEDEKRIAGGRFGVINLAFRFMLKQADFVAAESSYLLAVARKYGYRGKAGVVPNGVDMQKFQNANAKSQTSRNSKIVITTSRLVYKNGVDVLIKAIAEVKKNIPDVQLYILGDGPEKSNYQSLVASQRLGDSVRFLGYVSHDEIPRHLHAADLFVRASRSEGMGNSFIEALAAGVPIIGTPVGGITDIIEDERTGLFSRPEDHQDLAKKIVRMLTDKEFAVRCAEAGRRMVGERFTWLGVSNQYLRAFRNLLEKKLSIMVATPLLPPQLGGPARYAEVLPKVFSKRGHKVQILSFGKLLKYPGGIRHLFFFLKLLIYSIRADVILALDYFSVGLPAAVVSLFLRKPLVIRMEGDFLWEKFVERTRQDVTLVEFYLAPQPFSKKERLINILSSFVLRRASRVVFSSEWRRKMVIEAFKISVEKTSIIKNVLDVPVISHPPKERVILWAGRMLYLKNLYRLLLAFSKANLMGYELHLVGEGPEKDKINKFISNNAISNVKIFPSVSHEELILKICSSSALILPSLSDVGPNVIAEALIAGTPFLMTRESGYYEYFKDFGIFFDPLNEEEIASALKKITDGSTRAAQSNIIKRGWDEAAQEWLKELA